jgi:LAS superfamily LD-carboxypeptidase LdcB
MQYLSVDENGDGSVDDIVDSNNYTVADIQASQVGLKACTAGIVQVGVFDVCKTIAPNVDKMVAAAKSQNIILTGGGFRTRQEQISLRIKNCGGNTQYNIFQKSAKQCKPQTAIPGTSRHENGLALDLKCNGVGKYAFRNTKCFTWMKNNAAKYGFKNLPAEPWHWSIDGR